MKEYKVLFTGTMGAGKSTAVSAISDIDPIKTDVGNSDASLAKDTTTVAFDYGELRVSADECLRLYGTPGQRRFSFMWEVLAKGALGLIILVDNSRDEPLADLAIYLDNFSTLIREGACVIGVGRLERHPRPNLDDFSGYLAERGLLVPVVSADVREREDVLQLIDLLLIQLESRY